MISRRNYLELMLTGVATAIKPGLLFAADKKLSLIARAIPSSGERLPAVGLGSSATFSKVASREDIEGLREVLRALVDNGGPGVRYSAGLRGVRRSRRAHRQ